MKPYKIEFEKDVIKRDTKRLSQDILRRIQIAINAKLKSDPFLNGKPLRHNWKGFLRLRVGDYRVIYRIDEPRKTVIIFAIKHRRYVYES